MSLVMKSAGVLLSFATTAACFPWPLSGAGSSRVEALEPRATSSTPNPVSLTPSQYWDGDDGQWSTFEFQIGSPSQQIRLIPGTSTSTLYYIDPQGCSSAASPPDPSNCPMQRGGTFNPNGSSTYAAAGTYDYQASYSQTTLLGYDANSQMGTDTVTLGWPGSPDPPTISNQIVGGLLEKSIFYVGNFGIFPRPVNLSSLTNTKTSVMQNLRDQNVIPSLSYGYTAGWRDAPLPTFGSLTLGGYDTTRFRTNGNLSIPFGPDQTRDLLVPIQSISSSSANEAGGLLPNPIYAYIDSTIPTIWLPLEACQAFERAFNLTWSDDDQYYLLTDDQHDHLLSTNPTVTFTIGTALAGGQTVEIALPYKTFDLQLTAPIASQPVNYFPLQRAANNTQYVLGRTFLQQAYLIADYENNNFTVAQALFPQNVAPSITPIYAKGEEAAGGSQNPSQTGSTGLSGGAIAGIVIGIVAVIAIIAAALWYIRRQRKNKAAAAASTAPPSTFGDGSTMAEPQRPDLVHHPSSQPPEYGTPVYEKAELHGETSPLKEQQNPMSVMGKTELDNSERNVHEMGEDVREKRHEMDSSQVVNELDGESGGKKARKPSGQIYEMPG